MESLITVKNLIGSSHFGESVSLLSNIISESNLQSRNTTSSYPSKENSRVCSQEKRAHLSSLLFIIAKKWK